MTFPSLSTHSMPMKGQVKFHTAQNISGASRQNSMAAFSLTTKTAPGLVCFDAYKKKKETT